MTNSWWANRIGWEKKKRTDEKERIGYPEFEDLNKLETDESANSFRELVSKTCKSASGWRHLLWPIQCTRQTVHTLAGISGWKWPETARLWRTMPTSTKRCSLPTLLLDNRERNTMATILTMVYAIKSGWDNASIKASGLNRMSVGFELRTMVMEPMTARRMPNMSR